MNKLLISKKARGKPGFFYVNDGELSFDEDYAAVLGAACS